MNTRTLTQTNVQERMDGWTYRVVVSNASGAVTASSVRLTVRPNASRVFRVTRGNTFVGTTPNGGQIATIGIGGTFTRSAEAAVILGGWTWLRGRLTGTTVNPNTLVWISASQLERQAAGVECVITDPQNFGFISLRNSPTGANAGTLTTRTARFRPTGDPAVNASGFTWRLGTITNAPAQFNGTTMWIATTQLPFNSPCR